MKTHKKKLFKRVANAIAKTQNGCMSATCPFRDDDDHSVGTAMLCDCRQNMIDLASQLTREAERVK